MTGNQGLDSWRGQMDRWTKRPMVGWLSIQDWIRKKKTKGKKKRKKEKGAVWLPVFHSRKAGSRSYESLGESMRETSPHGWEKDPGSYYLGWIWELGIQHCPAER